MYKQFFNDFTHYFLSQLNVYQKKKNLSEEHMVSDRAKASFWNSSPCASKSGSFPDWI